MNVKKGKTTKSSYGPISQQAISLRANPDAIQAIEDYQSYMLNDQNLLISQNKAINALIVKGIKYLREVESDPAHAEVTT